MPDYTQLVLNNRRLGLPKAVVSPDLKSATVLTNEPWEYVDLYLARQGTAPATEARFYWQQSREFFNASIGLGLQAAPLCLYYSFMNATKALLRARSVSFKEHHGVASWKLDASSKLIDLSVGIKIKTDGVLPALSHYYNESERSNTHTLSDIFFNLPFIHRTYSLTNHPIKEIFIPLVRPSFVFDGASRAIRVMANLTADYPDPRHCKNLPQSFDWHIADGRYFLLSKQSAEISSTSDPTADDLEKLICLAKRIREDVYYISATART